MRQPNGTRRRCRESRKEFSFLVKELEKLKLLILIFIVEITCFSPPFRKCWYNSISRLYACLLQVEDEIHNGYAVISESIRSIMAARALHNIFSMNELHLVITDRALKLVDPGKIFRRGIFKFCGRNAVFWQSAMSDFSENGGPRI